MRFKHACYPNRESGEQVVREIKNRSETSLYFKTDVTQEPDIDFLLQKACGGV